MKKETISKIEKEINQKIVLPKNIKEKIKKDIFTNIIIAISMIVYFTFLMMGSVGTTKAVRSIDFNIFSILLLGVSIYLFEIAYKKENVSLAIYGIETLIVSVITLFFPYIIFELDEFHKKYYMIVSAYISVYYIIKSICIVSKAKKIHIKQSSDIKEIVKKEKRKDVIRVKEKTVDGVEHNDSQKKQTKKLEIANNENKNNVGVALLGDPEPKKRGRPKKNVGVAAHSDPQTEQIKKIEKVNDDNKPKEEVTPKKRGRPKKTETTNNENKNNVGVAAHSDPQREQTKKLEKKNNENKQKESDTPKKRGRPRKVVTAND